VIVRGGEYYGGDVIYSPSESGTTWYGSTSAAPSPDADGDGVTVCAGDCDDADASVYPGAPQICGDGLNNDCNHPSWPSLSGTNEADDDRDGVSECGGDCDDGNGSVQGAPSEVSGLMVAGASPALVSWDTAAGGTTLRYDTLRSSAAGDFVNGAVCVESDDPSDTVASDPDTPPLGGIFYYLVRAEDACPGTLGSGSLGFTSGGQPRQGRTCP
jgi:hypothetical protein